MELTPSAKSGFFAGLGVCILLWGMILKIDALAKLFHVQQRCNRERILT